MEGVTAIICLLVLLLAYLFGQPIAILIVSIANWVNYKAGFKGVYTMKDSE